MNVYSLIPLLRINWKAIQTACSVGPFVICRIVTRKRKTERHCLLLPVSCKLKVNNTYRSPE